MSPRQYALAYKIGETPYFTSTPDQACRAASGTRRFWTGTHATTEVALLV